MLIEQTIKEYLDGTDLSVDVVLEMPREIPESFVLFRVIDRGKENCINQVTVEFLSYAPSKYDAAVLDEQVRELMEGITITPDIFGCRFGGGNDTTDTTLKRYRYRCYFNLFY